MIPNHVPKHWIYTPSIVDQNSYWKTTSKRLENPAVSNSKTDHGMPQPVATKSWTVLDQTIPQLLNLAVFRHVERHDLHAKNAAKLLLQGKGYQKKV